MKIIHLKVVEFQEMWLLKDKIKVDFVKAKQKGWLFAIDQKINIYNHIKSKYIIRIETVPRLFNVMEMV